MSSIPVLPAGKEANCLLEITMFKLQIAREAFAVYPRCKLDSGECIGNASGLLANGFKAVSALGQTVSQLQSNISNSNLLIAVGFAFARSGTGRFLVSWSRSLLFLLVVLFHYGVSFTLFLFLLLRSERNLSFLILRLMTA